LKDIMVKIENLPASEQYFNIIDNFGTYDDYLKTKVITDNNQSYREKDFCASVF
jgi:hypothetical protein